MHTSRDSAKLKLMLSRHHNYNPKFLHHQKSISAALLREVVFGMEDGMVSTLGAITGIAFGTGDQFTILLAGFVVVSVESISMGVGSYLSNKSENAMQKRILDEERQEIKLFLKEETEELVDMYIKDGWTKKTAETMANEAAKNPDLMLKEMAYRELGVSPIQEENPIKNALYMGVSYIVGGIVPLLSYLFLEIDTAIITSISTTLFALFILGAATTKYTKRNWLKAGAEMLILASIASAIGFGVAKLANMLG